MSKRRMGGGGSRGRRTGPIMQAPLPPRRTPVVPETRRRPPRGMAQGGPIMKKKGYAAGGLKNGMMKKKGYANGGMMKKKGYAKGGKVRGAGIAKKGVRPCKMR